jgi:hypothetical protein
MTIAAQFGSAKALSAFASLNDVWAWADNEAPSSIARVSVNRGAEQRLNSNRGLGSSGLHQEFRLAALI